MELFWKITAGALIAAVLGLSVNREFGTMLSMAVCAMGIAVALEFVRPVMGLLEHMESISGVSGDFIKIMFKVMGIGLTAEFAGMICMDTGNGAMAKMLKLVAHLVILWISIPLFESVLSLIQQILGGV